MEYHKRAVDIAPDEPNLRSNLGIAYVNLGRFAEAEREFRFSIGLHETMTGTFVLGQTLMYEGKDQEAVPFLERAATMKSQPGGTKRYTPLMYLGIAYRRLNLGNKAKEANRRGLEMAAADLINPRVGVVLSYVAYFDAALGDRQHAETEITKALGLSNRSLTRWNAVLSYETLGLREKTLGLLSTSTREQLADVNRWPDLADLQANPRFIQLNAIHQLR